MQFHAVYTKPLQEFKLRDELCLLKIPHYLPVQLKSEIRRQKRIIVSIPLFGNYIFAGISNDDDWNAVKSCKGTSYILQNDGKPAIIPKRAIEILKMAEKAGAFDLTKKTKFQEGDDVEILDGPFAGVIAKVQSASPRKRVKILMNFLSGEVSTDIDDTHIRKVEAGPCNSVGTR